METKVRPARRRTKKQFLVDEKGRRTAVVLPIEEYERLRELDEDIADLRAADEARAEDGEDVSLDEFEAQLRAEGKLA
jgi:PHD/YefM family antitoxin component YafN of YafNO toxin-antitoxin module